MLSILLTIIVVALITYLYLKPLINNLLYSVPDEPKYIHSHIPFIGFGLKMFKDPIEFLRSLYVKYGKTFSIALGSKRFVYLYDEQTFLTKVLKSPDLSIDEFLIDFTSTGFDVNRRCLENEDFQLKRMKDYHQYLVGDELEILNKRAHDSLLQSMKTDAKSIQDHSTKTANMFDLFGEFMLYAASDALFGQAFTNDQRNSTPKYYPLFQSFNEALKLSVFRVPFRTILHRSIFEDRRKFAQRFYSLKLNKGESNLIHAHEERYRSDKNKDLFDDHDIGSLHAVLLWAAVVNTGPMSAWAVINLLLYPEALEAVKQELKENIPSSTSVYDKETLAKLKILDSCINESMRRVLNSAPTRQAMVNTTVECLDKTKIGLRKGDMLVYPAFLKHFDPELFGPNPYEFQYDRFVKKPNEPKAPSVMLFGCGTHMCPGRYWAINEIKILVILIIQHMDIEFTNMTEQDKIDYRKRLPYDYTQFFTSAGARKDCKHKFDIKYSYKNFDMN